MTARSVLLITSAMSAATLSFFACVGDAPAPPGVGEPCGGGCAAGLSCVNDVCAASPADSGAGGADGAAPGIDAGSTPDSGAGLDAALDAADDSCAYLPLSTTGVAVCKPGASCVTATQTCCQSAGGAVVGCNTSCGFRGSPVFIHCDGPEDCAANAVCCLRQTKLSDDCPRKLSYDPTTSVDSTNAVITACLSAAACVPGFRTCNAANGCGVGQTCVQAELPTGAFIGVCQ